MSGIAFSNAVKNVDLLSFGSIETLDLANPIFSSRDLLFSLGRVFLSFPSALTPNKFRMAGSQKKKKIQFFYQLTEESNQGRLGEKRNRYLCAMPSPMRSLVNG